MPTLNDLCDAYPSSVVLAVKETKDRKLSEKRLLEQKDKQEENKTSTSTTRGEIAKYSEAFDTPQQRARKGPKTRPKLATIKQP